jgi:hypothetical protein
LLKELNPIPKGYVGMIKIGDTRVLAQDNIVVLSHRDREELELYNQKIVTYFHMTNTWAKQQDGQWQIVATQVMAIPNERKPAAIDPKSLDAYVGQYELAPQVAYVITREATNYSGSGRDATKRSCCRCAGKFFTGKASGAARKFSNEMRKAKSSGCSTAAKTMTLFGKE